MALSLNVKINYAAWATYLEELHSSEHSDMHISYASKNWLHADTLKKHAIQTDLEVSTQLSTRMWIKAASAN